MKRSILRSTIVRRSLVVAVALCAWIGGAPAHAVQMTFSPSRDVTILGVLPDNNFGANVVIQTGIVGSAETRSLIGFNVSSLAGVLDLTNPDGTIVSSVTLRLFAKEFDGASVKTTNIYSIKDANANWVQGSQVNGGEVGAATWNSRQHTISTWAGSAGLSTVGTDYDGTLLATRVFASDPGVGTQIDFQFTGGSTALTNLIKHWAEVQNAGLLMLDPNAGSLVPATDRIQYSSFDDTNASLRPLLIIELSQVPEPSACVLLALGTVGLVARRRGRAAANRS